MKILVDDVTEVVVEEDIVEAVAAVAAVAAPVSTPAAPTHHAEPATCPEPVADAVNAEISALCEKFGDNLIAEFTKIVDTLKSELALQFGTRIVALETDSSRNDSRINALETENADLKTKNTEIKIALDSANARINTLNENFDMIADEIDRMAASTKPAQPKDIVDLVVAGDSIVKHINVEGMLSTVSANSLICIPGAKAHEVHKAVLTYARSATPNDLVIHIGTNHLPEQTPVEAAYEIETTLKQLQLELPDTKIHFSQIIPKIDPSFHAGIKFINRKTERLCKEIGIGFINHPGFVHPENGHLRRNLFSPSEWRRGEPLHPSHDGVRCLEYDINRHLAQDTY